MSRFFKSAAFPILIVVVLAFFAQKLISPGPSESSKPQFGDFQQQLAQGDVRNVVKKTNGWLSLLTYILPFLIFIGFWIFLMNQVQGGGSKVMSFGKSRAKRLSVDSPKISFRDVAGVDEA